MSRMLVAILSLVIFNIANAANTLKSVNAYQVGEEFITELNFDAPLSEEQLNLEYINQTVQLSLNNVVLEKDTLNRKIKKHDRFKSIYTYQPEKNIVFSRIIQKNSFMAEELKNSIDIEFRGRVVLVKISEPSKMVAVKAVEKKPTEMVFTPPNNLETPAFTALPEKVSKKLDSTSLLAMEMGPIDKAVAKLQVKENKLKKIVATDVVKAVSKTDITGLKESEIPVLTAVKAEKKSSSSPVFRMIMSLVVVIAMGVGVTLFTKWWSKKNLKSLDNNKIRMLTQHHLGPKKSLAIIQVAGESILIGVTDQNINMIKTLSLLDEEVPEISGKESFSNSLEAKMATDKALSADDGDEFAFTKIKDLVSSRLKDMRPL